MKADEPLGRRKWCYVMQPHDYDIAGCNCGWSGTQWSEFVDRIWCPHCKVDYVPGHWGIFDGPIQPTICGLIGLSFSRFEISTGRIAEFGTPEWEGARP